ncbi:MAG: hypothetical protein ACRCX2_10280 [Paraclostridium sp.]
MEKRNRNSHRLNIILFGALSGLFTGLNGLGTMPTIVLIAIVLFAYYTGYFLGTKE